MTIYKPNTFVDVYKAKASATEINELSGRTGRPDLTKYVNTKIVEKLPLNSSSVLVDIGCGEGSLLMRAAENGVDGFSGRLIGLLPTKEEIARVRVHLANQENLKTIISIEFGEAENTRIPNDYCDILICNGVLLIIGNKNNVSNSLAEFFRITKSNGTIFIGEIPDTNEMVGKNYGDSITNWLLWVLKNQGFKAFLKRIKQTLPAFFSKEPFVIAPKNIFFMPPNDFIAFLNLHGIQVIEYYRHKEVDSFGNEYESRTRWNYVGIKTLS